MSRTAGEGRGRPEKSGRVIIPNHVREAEREALAREEAEWAARSGPVEVRRVQMPRVVQFAVSLLDLESGGLEVIRYHRERARHMLNTTQKVYLTDLRREPEVPILRGEWREA